jgi:PadR family transcriptional regulator PadR
MNLEIQSLSRNCNEALILSVLSSGPHHGYQLALELEERSHGTFRFQHGTLYPILHRLEKDGLISGDWLDEGSKRKRKSYRLTAAGSRRLHDQRDAWRAFVDRFFHVVEEG